MSEIQIVRNADQIWRKIRWAKTNGEVVCPVCGHTHIYTLKDGRYKCAQCRKLFSDTSDTILHHSHLSKAVWLLAIFKFAALKECSAIDLQKTCGISYNAAYMVLQKLRYAVRNHIISLDGVVRMDEAYIGAEWNNIHLRKKFQYMKDHNFMPQSAKRYTKHQLLCAVSAYKSHILSLTDEHNNTLLLHVPNPVTKDCIKSIVCAPKHKITALITDESQLYRGLPIPVAQSNHSKRKFTTSDGLTSNVAENRFSWVKRKLEGVFTHVSDKYLQLYLWQRQYHFNTMSKTPEERFFEVAGLCLARVRNKDIVEFNYKAAYPKSKREKAKEEAEYALSCGCGLIATLTDQYGVIHKR